MFIILILHLHEIRRYLPSLTAKSECILLFKITEGLQNHISNYFNQEKHKNTKVIPYTTHYVVRDNQHHIYFFRQSKVEIQTNIIILIFRRLGGRIITPVISSHFAEQ